MRCFRSLFIFFLLGLAHCNHSDPSQSRFTMEPVGPPVLNIGTQIRQEAVKRFGINLIEPSYWGSGQIMKNLVGQNPGFEGHLYASVVEVGQGNNTDFVDADSSGAWESGFWDGAAYEVIWGKAAGRRGIIRTFVREENPKRFRYLTTERGEAFQPGDHVVLKKSFDGDPDFFWWPRPRGTGTFQVETSDLPPGSVGNRCLKAVASGESDVVTLHAYLDSLQQGERAFLPLKGRYRLYFKAKALQTPMDLSIEFFRLTRRDHKFIGTNLELSGEWQNYELFFDADEDDLAGTLDLAFSSNRSFLLDDVSLVNIEDTNPTVFRKEVVETLQALRPGILRFWAGQLTDSLENQLAPAGAARGKGYSRWSMRPLPAGYNLPQFLELCKLLDTEPWYVVPISFSAEESAALIEYLAGPPDSPMGRIRSEAGQEQPWTEVFDTIHLEYGNEAWNRVYRGGNVEKSRVYAERGSELFGVMRSQADFTTDRFNLILGGQSAWPERNEKIHGSAGDYDSLALAPYLMSEADEVTDPNLLFEMLFADFDEMNRKGAMFRNAHILRNAKQSISIYEVNLHTTKGTVSQESLDAFTPSAGAAVGVACHMMTLLAEFGARDQCFYNLNQYSTQAGDGKTSWLWGAVRDMATEPVKRPIFLALELCNEALQGNMMEVSLPLFKQVNLPAPIRAFAFKDGSRHALLLFNLDQKQTLSFGLKGIPEPKGPVRLKRLDYKDPTDNNETEQLVDIEETTFTDFHSGSTLSIEPGAMLLYIWESDET